MEDDSDYGTYMQADDDYDDYEYLENGGLSDFDGEDAMIVAYHRANSHQLEEEVWSLVSNCMGTILKQSFDHVKLLLLVCLILRFAIIFINQFFKFSKKSLVTHFISSVFGIIVLYDMFSDIYQHLLILLSLFLLCTYFLNVCFTKFRNGGTVASLGTISFILLSEIFFANPTMWNRIRGLLLITAMKIVSVSIDRDRKVQNLPNLVEFFGYCLHPGSLIFGPWISFQEYTLSIEASRPLSISWSVCVLKSAAQAAVCLLLSDCALSYLFINPANAFSPAIFPIIANSWMLSYETAVSFHFSHFYVNYVATLTCLLSGVGTITHLKAKSETNSANENSTDLIWSKFVLTKPLSVEIPRSMLSVAVAWNISISKWLKMYVFDSSRFLGDFIAVIFTYAASAMLHGLSFHLAAILLSLGFYTYTEHSLRKKLAEIFQCPSIEARPKDRNASSPIWARLFNLSWILINIMHLAYLGSMFEYEDQETDTGGFSLNFTLSKWSQLGYISHVFALSCLVFNWLI